MVLLSVKSSQGIRYPRTFVLNIRDYEAEIRKLATKKAYHRLQTVKGIQVQSDLI